MNKAKLSIALYFLFLSFNIFSQNIIRNYEANYQCLQTKCTWNQVGQYVCTPSSILKSISVGKLSDNSQLEIQFDDGYKCMLYKENDTVFVGQCGLQVSTNFYYNDSIEIVRVYSSVGYAIYNGKKSIINKIKAYNNQEYEIFPNPFCDELFINDPKNDLLSFALVDLSGRLTKVSFSKFQNKVCIKTNELKSGIYFLQLKDFNSINTVKIIKYKYH